MDKYVLIYEDWFIDVCYVVKIYFNDIKTLNEKVQEIKSSPKDKLVFSGLIKEEYNHDISS